MSDHIDYIRVSTVDQNTDRQLADIHLDRPPFKDKMSKTTLYNVYQKIRS